MKINAGVQRAAELQVLPQNAIESGKVLILTSLFAMKCLL